MKLNKNFRLIVGAMLMFSLGGCSAMQFEKYSSKDPLINISLEYLSGWQSLESRGSYNSYAQAIFYPFKKGQKSPRVMMAVTVRDGSKISSAPLTLQSVADDLLARRMQFKEAKVLTKSKITLLNTEAIVLELSYLTLEDLRSVNSKLILVKEKVILFKKNNNFYFLRYESAAQEFAKYLPAFTHMVATLKIK